MLRQRDRRRAPARRLNAGRDCPICDLARRYGCASLRAPAATNLTSAPIHRTPARSRMRDHDAPRFLAPRSARRWPRWRRLLDGAAAAAPLRSAAASDAARCQQPQRRARPTSTSCGATSTASSAACSAARAAARAPAAATSGGAGESFQPDMKSAGIGVGADRGRRGADLARQRLLHRAGRPAGGRHLVRQVQPAPWTPASSGACPTRSRRHETVAVTQLRSVDVGRNTVVQATGLRDSSMLTAGREHRRHPLHRAVPPEGRARLPVREPQPDEAVVQAAEIGGARDRRPQPGRLGAVRAARRDRRRAASSRSRPSSTASRPAS